MEDIATLFIVLGIILFILGILMLLWNSIQKNEREIRWGGVVFIGPLPIVFGDFPWSLALVIAFFIFILFFILSSYSR